MPALRARKLVPSDYRVMPWKNGMGFTTELAVEPAGAGLDGFDWRLSMADVVSDGDFSLYPGYDRTLMLATGKGLELDFAAASAPQRLRRPGQAAQFSGDWPARCHLLDGPVRDFNVMTARGRVEHECLEIAGMPTEFVWEPGFETLFCLSISGTLVLKMPGASEWQLDSEESVWLPVEAGQEGLASLMVMPHSRGTLGAVVRLRAN
ncbi:MAG: HutD family protein [Bacillota bacterium]